jgi:hypothetical protein
MTTPEPRKKKPSPARTRPVRGFSKVLRTPDSSSPSAPDARSFAPLIERTVRTGYGLVEEYVQAGRAAAEQLRQRQPRKDDDAAEQTGDRLADYMTHLAFAGLEYIQAMSRIPGQPPPTGTAPPFSAPAQAGVNGRPSASVNAPTELKAEPERAREQRIQVSVEASIPVQVTLELDPGARRGTIIAQAARPTGSRQGRTVERGIGIEIRTTSQLTVARIRVASKVAKGSYRSRLVQTDNNLPCGHLKIQVLAVKPK